ncbi:partial Type IV pilus biogenesis factor PilY1, partial [Geobacteraceae bacterium]
MKRNISRLTSLSCLAALLAVAAPAVAATMNDYCIQPPFINASIPPNLLMLIDNSASMYDLAYVDKGNESNGTFTRQPYYCFDLTYDSATKYVGYFDPVTYYSYNFGSESFEAVAVTDFPAAGSCTKYIANNLCIVYAGTDVTSFVAKGNYLNWLAASKFDVQKEILTGGKYESGKLVAESRGCVGQPFVKKPNTGDFVNYSSPETNNPNTPLGITFGVRGKSHPHNPSAPSLGGQTELDIYLGNYNQGPCQDAVKAITSGGNADIKQAVDACLTPIGIVPPTAVTKTKVSFQQSMQACWQYREGQAIGTDDINTVRNQCTDLYDEYGTCSNDPKKVCTSDAACDGNSCIFGPSAITPGNPALLCGSGYEGQYYTLSAATGTCKKKNSPDGGPCASDDDCTDPGYKCSGAAGVGWVLKPGVTEAAMIATHEQFCNDMTAPPVTDPTDSPSDTAMYDNVPAILTGVGLEAQLNQPIATLKVRLSTAAPPTGLVQDYADRIRFGVMQFNDYGSESETAALGAPRVCSNDPPKITCTSDVDCGEGNTCNATTAGTNNTDGGTVTHYIGKGKCSVTTATLCATDANCPGGERCISDGAGDHTTSGTLVKAIDDIRAATWTPFAEAMYNAIGYFAKDTTDASGKSSRADVRLNTTEDLSFPLDKNPVQYRCQSNNILIISDGMSTADQNGNVSSLAQLYTAAGGETGTCSQYAGSKNLDNLAWLAQNRNIQTFSTTTASPDVPNKASEAINTFVVFTGESNGQAGECNSETLMEQTAIKGRQIKEGDPDLFRADDPSQLEDQLRSVFDQIANRTASGTAASILSNSEGSGASILQAVFYPKKDFLDNTSATWLGEMQNLWYYVDPNIGNSTVREDTEYDGSTRALNLKGDKVVRFFFDPDDPNGPKTKASLTPDTDGDGDGDGAGTEVDPDVIKSLWRAGNQLWSRETSRDIITTCLKATCAETEKTMAFSTANASVLRPYLGAATDAEAEKLIQYVQGTDFSDFRSRTVTTTNFLTGNTETHVWKLGDIISSTPRILSPLRLNTYHLSLPSGYNDASYTSFLGSNQYKNRNLAFVGANDGMLHAFRLGTMDVRARGFTKATLNGTDIGKEVGAFIPQHTLPYLKYLANDDYSHLFFVDGPTLIFDASIGKPGSCTQDSYSDCVKQPVVIDGNKNLDATKNPWRTILIGSMGLGGAAKSKLDSCTADLNGDAEVDGKDCVKTPITDPKDATKGFGYSSYFAFDYTDQDNPKLLWEFSDPQLGFSTSGPAIIRVGDPIKNGKWFAVFASGPTGP